MRIHRESAAPGGSKLLPNFFCRQPLVFLGGISFPIFIVHQPIGQIFYKKAVASAIFGHNLASPQPNGLHWFFGVYWIIVLCVAYLLQKVPLPPAVLEPMASAAASSEKPGFFAADVHEALRKRAEWLEGLGESAILDADNLDSDDSEHWEGSTTGAKDEPVAGASRPFNAQASAAQQVVAPPAAAPAARPERRKPICKRSDDWDPSAVRLAYQRRFPLSDPGGTRY
eukprot:s91_g1.t1